MRLWLGALIALTVLRLVLAATLPLAPDEAYYFLWSQDLQPGYLDHPSMVALLIRAGVFCFGDTPLGIRLFGPLLAAAGSVLLWDAGERLFPHRHAGVMAAALLNATLMVGVGSIIMTPDTPLLFFWTAGLAAFARLITSGNPRWWLVIGVVMGLALYSKYTALLFIAAAFIWLVTSTEGRAALRTPWPWVAVVLALLVFAPNIAWNAAHGWASYFKQGGRVDGFDAARSLQFLSEFVFGQIGLFTPIIFGLAALGLWRLGDARTPAGHLSGVADDCAGGGVSGACAVRAGAAELGGDIVSVCVPGGGLAADGGVAAVVGAGAWARVFAEGLWFMCRRWRHRFRCRRSVDPTALQFPAGRELAVASAAQKPAFLTSDDYATTAALGLLCAEIRSGCGV